MVNEATLDHLLMDQAGMTVGHWLRQADSYIDKVFGEGYAKKNPALVAAFIQAAAIDQLTGHLTTRIASRIADLSQAVSEGRDSVSALSRAVAEGGR